MCVETSLVLTVLVLRKLPGPRGKELREDPTDLFDLLFLEEEDFSDSVSTSNSFNFCVKIKTCSCEVEFLHLSLFDEQSSSMYFVFLF